MDWSLAIDINRKALLRIVAGLFVMAGFVPGGALVETLARHVHVAIFAVLRPAEAAVRRLIVMQAWGLDSPGHVPGTAPAGPISGKNGKGRVPAFPLFDPRMTVDPGRKRAPRNGPNIRFFDGLDEPFRARRAATPDDPVSALRLCQRLLAIRAALNDLPKQARRLMRALARPSCKWKRVMRYARPPGHRAKGKREIDMLLANLQIFALWATEAPDTG